MVEFFFHLLPLVYTFIRACLSRSEEVETQIHLHTEQKQQKRREKKNRSQQREKNECCLRLVNITSHVPTQCNLMQSVREAKRRRRGKKTHTTHIVYRAQVKL